jgi:natural resistance-associated macrophage protein 2
VFLGHKKFELICTIVAGDLQAGTYGGYGLIWSLFLATFCGLIIQILAARLAIVTNRDLATHCREQFSKPLTYSLWLMAEIAIIGSDIQVETQNLIFRK